MFLSLNPTSALTAGNDELFGVRIFADEAVNAGLTISVRFRPDKVDDSSPWVEKFVGTTTTIARGSSKSWPVTLNFPAAGAYDFEIQVGALVQRQSKTVSATLKPNLIVSLEGDRVLRGKLDFTIINAGGAVASNVLIKVYAHDGGEVVYGVQYYRDFTTGQLLAVTDAHDPRTYRLVAAAASEPIGGGLKKSFAIPLGLMLGKGALVSVGVTCDNSDLPSSGATRRYDNVAP